eukprot:7457483-Alexandrium_andersonii.AAC.1
MRRHDCNSERTAKALGLMCADRGSILAPLLGARASQKKNLRHICGSKETLDQSGCAGARPRGLTPVGCLTWPLGAKKTLKTVPGPSGGQESLRAL